MTNNPPQRALWPRALHAAPPPVRWRLRIVYVVDVLTAAGYGRFISRALEARTTVLIVSALLAAGLLIAALLLLSAGRPVARSIQLGLSAVHMPLFTMWLLPYAGPNLFYGASHPWWWVGLAGLCAHFVLLLLMSGTVLMDYFDRREVQLHVDEIASKF